MGFLIEVIGKFALMILVLLAVIGVLNLMAKLAGA